jgi:hypothetical protein
LETKGVLLGNDLREGGRERGREGRRAQKSEHVQALGDLLGGGEGSGPTGRKGREGRRMECRGGTALDRVSTLTSDESAAVAGAWPGNWCV